jgi:hypothetical protein
MVTKNWRELVELMRARGIDFDAGLTDTEVVATETQFGFQFPADLREFLQTALPRGKGFPDWRSGAELELREWLDLPLRGILFDIEHNNFWLEEWGARPDSLVEAIRVVKDLVATAPRLIPIYHHRMMPSEPNMAGNPVFSVHQTDIIHYGTDLETYLRNEFNLLVGKSQPDEIRQIRFWNIDRFQEVRWADGSCVTDPNTLPEEIRNTLNSSQEGVSHKSWWQFWR